MIDGILIVALVLLMIKVWDLSAKISNIQRDVNMLIGYSHEIHAKHPEYLKQLESKESNDDKWT